MRTPRFHCPQAVPGLDSGTRVELPAAAAHHALRVLRLSDGDPIAVFAGTGGEYAAVLEAARGKPAQARLAAFHAVDRAPQVAVHVLQSVVAAEKMDWVVEKAVELGAASLTPVGAERSVVRLSGERAARRLLHWQALAVAASEQCGLNRLLEVHPVQALEAACARFRTLAMPCCRLDPEGECSLTEFVAESLAASVPAAGGAAPTPAAAPPALALLVGPEGGFSAREAALAAAAGFRSVTLGPRVLRTETAALAALATIRAIADDFRHRPS